MNLEQAAQLGVLLAGVVLAKRRCRAKPTDANPAASKDFFDGSFVTLGCCFVIEFRAYYDTIPGLISARLGLHCNDAYVSRGRLAMAAWTSGGFWCCTTSTVSYSLSGSSVTAFNTSGSLECVVTPMNRVFPDFLASASTSRYSVFITCSALLSACNCSRST